MVYLPTILNGLHVTEFMTQSLVVMFKIYLFLLMTKKAKTDTERQPSVFSIPFCKHSFSISSEKIFASQLVPFPLSLN